MFEHPQYMKTPCTKIDDGRECGVEAEILELLGEEWTMPSSDPTGQSLEIQRRMKVDCPKHGITVISQIEVVRPRNSAICYWQTSA